MIAIALKALGFARGLLSPLASLWRWLTADWHRMAFAVLIALCGFLGWRLHSVDGDRDDWRDKATAMIERAKELEKADAKADAAGTVTAAETKGKVDATNERARRDAVGSDDPLDAIAKRLRAEGGGQDNEAPS